MLKDINLFKAMDKNCLLSMKDGKTCKNLRMNILKNFFIKMRQLFWKYGPVDNAHNAVVILGYLGNSEKFDKVNTRKKHGRLDLSIFFLNFLIAFFVFSSIQTNAQSRHYWSQNFNTESSLVAGAVVGGYAGPSAIYFNPALISKDDSHKFALSVNLFSFQDIVLDNIASEGTQYDNFIFKVQPKFISYTWVPKKNPKLTVELAFMVPITYNIKFTYIYNEQVEVINRLDGVEEYTGKIGYKYLYDDYYAGGGLSKKISDRVTMGASGFLSIKVLDYGKIIVNLMGIMGMNINTWSV